MWMWVWLRCLSLHCSTSIVISSLASRSRWLVGWFVWFLRLAAALLSLSKCLPFHCALFIIYLFPVFSPQKSGPFCCLATINGNYETVISINRAHQTLYLSLTQGLPLAPFALPSGIRARPSISVFIWFGSDFGGRVCWNCTSNGVKSNGFLVGSNALSSSIWYFR